MKQPYRSSQPVGMPRLQWLIERMNAGGINDPETERFGKHPGGPIVPALCRESRRLPRECGALPDRRSPVLALSVADTYPYVATVREGSVSVWCGGTRLTLRAIPRANSNSALPRCDVVRFVGFLGQDPVLQVTEESVRDKTHPSGIVQYLYAGDRLVASGSIYGAAVQEGDLYYTLRDSDPEAEKPFLVFRNGVPVGEPFRNVPAWFVKKGARMLVGTRLDAQDPGTTCIVRDLEKPDEEKRVAVSENVAAFVTAHGEPCWITEHRYGCIVRSLRLEDKDTQFPVWAKQIGENPYLSDFRELPGGYYAYIGMTMRDHLECWVIGQKEQIGFDSVSPLFRLDGGWAYWGALDRHLYLMDIPAKEG